MSTRIYHCDTQTSGVSVEVDGVSDKVKRVHNTFFIWMLGQRWAHVSRWPAFVQIQETDPEPSEGLTSAPQSTLTTGA